MHKLFFFLSLLCGGLVSAQPPEVPAVRKYGAQNADNIMAGFSSSLSFRNVAAAPAGLQQNAARLMSMMTKRGIQNVQLLPASAAGS